MWQARHGDILLEEMKELPPGSILLETSDRIIVAKGETTGHAHVMVADRPIIEMWRLPDGNVAIRNAVRITHEEHGVILMPPLVRIIPQIEANWKLEGEWQRVVD